MQGFFEKALETCAKVYVAVLKMSMTDPSNNEKCVCLRARVQRQDMVVAYGSRREVLPGLATFSNRSYSVICEKDAF